MQEDNSEKTKNSYSQLWIGVAVGITFLILAGVGAFLTGYLLGVRDSSELVALAIIASVATAIGVLILLVVAILFHTKTAKKQ